MCVYMCLYMLYKDCDGLLSLGMEVPNVDPITIAVDYIKDLSHRGILLCTINKELFHWGKMFHEHLHPK